MSDTRPHHPAESQLALERAAWRQIIGETTAAFRSMRDSINEHISMRSYEADLAHGPEMMVSYEYVARAVVAHVRAQEAAVGLLQARIRSLDAQLDRLRLENDKLKDHASDLHGWVNRLRKKLERRRT